MNGSDARSAGSSLTTWEGERMRSTFKLRKPLANLGAICPDSQALPTRPAHSGRQSAPDYQGIAVFNQRRAQTSESAVQFLDESDVALRLEA